MIRDWLIVGLVFAVLWVFWLCLGEVFDAITQYHAALREREDAQATRGTGSSAS